jgi:hypothetical protein
VEGLRRASEVEIIDAVGLKVSRKIREHFQETEVNKKYADDSN